MDNLLLDTNVIVDYYVGGIINSIDKGIFNVSGVVFKEEVSKQIKDVNFNYINIINESLDELLEAYEYNSTTKSISFYDALNVCIAKKRSLCLVTGDQNLKKYAQLKEVKCFGTLKLVEKMVSGRHLDREKAINALTALKKNSQRRLPDNLIDETIKILSMSVNVL